MLLMRMIKSNLITTFDSKIPVVFWRPEYSLNALTEIYVIKISCNLINWICYF